MSPFQQALGNAKLSFLCLGVALFVSLILNIVLAIGLANAPNHVRITLNRVPEAGVSLSLGDIPTSSVYALAQNVWLNLNSWQNNGFKDAVGRINSANQKGLVTAHFLKQYRAILDQYLKQGFVKQYRRIVLPTHGGFFDAKNIHKVGNSYLVRLTMTSLFYFVPTSKADNKAGDRDTQSFDNLSTGLTTHPVKTLTTEYIFKVVPYPNQMGMALDEIVSAHIVDQQTNLGGGQ